MTKADSRTRAGRNRSSRVQERGERTRLLVIEETIRCIREEGFAAASTRHIVDRAGVSWGVIQYHFGDRDGLLTAVIEHATATLVTSLNTIVEAAAEITDPRQRAESLTGAAWQTFFGPTAMTALEILIATRSMRGELDAQQLSQVLTAIGRLASALGEDSVHAPAMTNLLWAAPVGMMVAQMVISQPLPTADEQHALATLIGDHLSAPRPTRRRGAAR